jgi:hypothetical protein
MEKEYIVDTTFIGYFNIGDLVRNKNTQEIFTFNHSKYHCDFNKNFERVIEKTKK